MWLGGLGSNGDIGAVTRSTHGNRVANAVGGSQEVQESVIALSVVTSDVWGGKLRLTHPREAPVMKRVFPFKSPAGLMASLRSTLRIWYM